MSGKRAAAPLKSRLAMVREVSVAYSIAEFTMYWASLKIAEIMEFRKRDRC
jgi:hypothetical protein